MTGSPPKNGLKKGVENNRSSNRIVTPDPRIGNVRMRSIDADIIDQVKRQYRFEKLAEVLDTRNVAIKVKAPPSLDKPNI